MADIQRIESVSGLDELLEGAKDRQVWIFKHSLTCPISGAAWAEFKRFAADHSQENGTVFAVIEIQYARPVSAALAERTGVRHQSPQAILLREGRVSWHASHYEIVGAALRQA